MLKGFVLGTCSPSITLTSFIIDNYISIIKICNPYSEKTQDKSFSLIIDMEYILSKHIDFIPYMVYILSQKHILYPFGGDFLNKNNLAITVKKNRKKLHLTQVEAAERAGVGLRFIRELECGKKTLRMDKVNDLLFLFGLELGPVPMERDDE